MGFIQGDLEGNRETIRDDDDDDDSPRKTHPLHVSLKKLKTLATKPAHPPKIQPPFPGCSSTFRYHYTTNVFPMSIIYPQFPRSTSRPERLIYFTTPFTPFFRLPSNIYAELNGRRRRFRRWNRTREQSRDKYS